MLKTQTCQENKQPSFLPLFQSLCEQPSPERRPPHQMSLFFHDYNGGEWALSLPLPLLFRLPPLPRRIRPLLPESFLAKPSLPDSLGVPLLPDSLGVPLLPDLLGVPFLAEPLLSIPLLPSPRSPAPFLPDPFPYLRSRLRLRLLS